MTSKLASMHKDNSVQPTDHIESQLHESANACRFAPFIKTAVGYQVRTCDLPICMGTREGKNLSEMLRLCDAIHGR